MAYEFTGEIVACRLCGSHDHDAIAKIGRDGARLHTVICRDCGLVFTNPMPSAQELRSFYSLRYRADYKGADKPKLRQVYRSALRALPRWDRIRTLGHSGGRLLDVGSGGGEFLYLMRQLGFAAQGIEPNQGYGRFSHDEYGLDVELQSLEAMDFAPESFDVITLNHVLEHLRDPVAMLRRLHDWLAPDGVLIVEVPNVEARYHAPRSMFHFAHLVNFSGQTLLATGARAGLHAINLELTPAVNHINVAFSRAPGGSSAQTTRDPAHCQAIAEALRTHTRRRHYLSRTPYRRLLANLSRPGREWLAISGKHSPQAILDGVFAPLLASSLNERG